MPDTKSSAWAAEDVVALTRLWPSAPRAEIEAALPSRSWKAIRSRATILPVRRHVLPPQGPRWTKAEIETLRAKWGAGEAALRAALPGRSWEAIKGKANLERIGGVARDAYARWTPAEDAIMRRSYATAPWPKLLAALPGRALPNIKEHARSLGLARKRRPDALDPGIPGSVWKIVPGRHVHVSDHGQVRSVRTGKLLARSVSARSPIPSVKYKIDGCAFYPTVPQLMLEAFRPEETPSGNAGLRDQDVTNLSLENVYWTGRGRQNTPKPAPAKSQSTDRAKVLVAVSAAVPRYHEPHVRDDIVQDVVAAVLAGEATLEGLPPAIRKATTRHHAAAGTYRTVSLDAEVFDGSKQTFVDRLADDVARF